MRNLFFFYINKIFVKKTKNKKIKLIKSIFFQKNSISSLILALGTTALIENMKIIIKYVFAIKKSIEFFI